MSNPVAEADRLWLECCDEEHVEPLVKLGQGEVVRFLGGEEWTPNSVRELILLWHGIEAHLGITTWAVRERRTGDVIGTCGFAGTNAPWLRFDKVIEIGWTLGRTWWGRGFATEAAQASLGVGREHYPIDRFISKCHRENVASEQVMIRLGMQRAGLVRGRVDGLTVVYRFRTS